MNEVSPKILKTVQTLAQIAAELRQGKVPTITRLTLLKSLCSDPEATAKFALHIAKRTLKKMKERDCPSHITPDDWEQYRRLAAQAVRGMTKYLREGTTEAASPLRDLLIVIRNAQSQFERQEWGPVRIIESGQLLMVETALECVLHPWASSELGYRLARQYAERYNPHYAAAASRIRPDGRRNRRPLGAALPGARLEEAVGEVILAQPRIAW